MGSYDRYEEKVCAEEGKGVLFVKRREGRDARVYKGTAEKGVYQTLKVTSNDTGIFHGKEGWEEEDGTRLSISQ